MEKMELIYADGRRENEKGKLMKPVCNQLMKLELTALNPKLIHFES